MVMAKAGGWLNGPEQPREVGQARHAQHRSTA